jgi:hypothetical protein
MALTDFDTGPSGDEAVRPDRRAVGGAGAVAARAVAARSAVVVEQTAVDRRDPVAGAHRRAVARSACRVWVLGGGLWIVPAVATCRCLAADSDRVAGPGRGRGADHVGCERGFHDRAGASACRGGAEKGVCRPSRRAGSPPSRRITRWAGRVAG